MTGGRGLEARKDGEGPRGGMNLVLAEGAVRAG